MVARKWYYEHKEYASSYEKLYNEAFKEERKIQGRIYYKAHSDEIKAYQKIYNRTHKEARNTKARKYMQSLRDGEIMMFGKTHNELFRRMFNA